MITQRSKLVGGAIATAALTLLSGPVNADLEFSGDTILNQDGVFGDYLSIGHAGPGSLIVNDGAVIGLDSGSLPDIDGSPFFVVGRQPGGDGTATITGVASAIQLNGSSAGDSAVATHVGRGGTGSL